MSLFVAITLSPAFRQAVLETMELLRAQCASGSFTRPENLHITLAFLGELPSPVPARQALEQVDFAPFPITLEGAGHYGDLWWAGLRRSPQLLNLSEQVRRKLDKQRISFDRKPFRPHITLARRAVLLSPGSASLKVEPASMQVESIVLMKSQRVQGRLLYSPVFRREARQDSPSD